MSLDKVWLSYIDYRPDPALPKKDRLALGCILEARSGRGRLFSVIGRTELTRAELHLMDGIGRELLAHPADFLKQEVCRLLGESREGTSFEQGGVLRALSRIHRWSLFVMPPQAIRIERDLSQSNQQALHTASEQLFIAHTLGKSVSLKKRLRAKRIIPDDWREQVPPAWQVAHRSFDAPARSSAQP